MRSLTIVIDRMLEVIPNDEIDLARGLLDLKSSAEYAAPEIMSFWWNETAEYLNYTVGNSTAEWAGKVHSIFCGV